MDPLLNICSAFGLSGAAGLNAYIPLLTISIMQKCGAIALAKPYDIMGQWWVIILLAVLLAVEIVADKIPGVDHVNDVIHSFIRPTAGALIFAAEMGNVTSVHPGVWLAIGLLLAGGVHAGKAVARPIVNVSTAGLGAPVVSTIENLVSITLSIVAIVAPIIAVILLALFAWVLIMLFRRFFGAWRKKNRPQSAPLVTAPVDALMPVAVPPAKAAGSWGGGL
jgi:hypothetical protein